MTCSFQNRSAPSLSRALRTLGAVFVWGFFSPFSHAQSMNTLASQLAPHGTLRASINLGNPILAYKDSTGQPAGVSIEIPRLSFT